MIEQLQAAVVDCAASLRDAMVAIDRGGAGICLVVDAEQKPIGTLTDGDIRRALLSGAVLGDRSGAFMRRDFTAVRETVSRAEVLDLMRARSLQQIPILDAHGRLVGLHLLREIIGAVPRPNWAVIMAGGRGERLRPLTDSLPKPMVRVAGRPILERLVLHLVGYGIRRIFIAVNYMAEVIESHFGDGTAHGCRVDYLRESKPMGTGGALSLLPEEPHGPILVLNGDLLTQCDLGRMLSFHAEGGYKMTLGVHEYVHTVPYGVVQTRGSSITALEEKPTASWLTNAGIYVIEPELLTRVLKDEAFPLTALVDQCLERGEPVGAFFHEEDWMDVGQPRDLARANGMRARQ